MTLPAPLLRRSLILDAHADTPQRFADEHWNFTDDLGIGHLNLSTAHAGGLSGEFFAIWPEPGQWRGRFAHRALNLIDAVYEQVRKAPDALALCRTADEIVAAHASGRFAIMLGLEGGHAIENSLALLRQYFALGVRYMTLTWANSNEWADSSGDQDDPQILPHGGLTSFGRDVIREMNRLGMMVDVSHVSDAAFADVLSVARAPVLASHSSARALTPAPRNLTDDMIRTIAGTGGAVMVNFYPAFIDETWRSAWNALTPERQKRHEELRQSFENRGAPLPYALSNTIDLEFADRIPPAPLASLIDHIDHIANIAGIDHVGIGSDFDGIPALPAGIHSAADLPKVADALIARGYSEQAISKIFGENLLRVLRAVDQAAAR